MYHQVEGASALFDVFGQQVPAKCEAESKKEEDIKQKDDSEDNDDNEDTFEKSYEVYGSSGNDDDFYLNLTKQAAVDDRKDVLALLLLGNSRGVTWERVARDTREPLPRLAKLKKARSP